MNGQDLTGVVLLFPPDSTGPQRTQGDGNQELAGGSSERAGETPDLVAGVEMDRAVAERVMQRDPSLSWEILLNDDEHASAIGFEREAAAIKWLDEHPSMKASHHVGTWKHYPHYSEDIAAAMEVVEKMRERFLVSMMDEDDKWRVCFETFSCQFEAEDESLPTAICLAALKTHSDHYR